MTAEFMVSEAGSFNFFCTVICHKYPTAHVNLTGVLIVEVVRRGHWGQRKGAQP